MSYIEYRYPTEDTVMIDRRTIITAALAAIAGPVAARSAMAQGAVSRITAYAFAFPALAGAISGWPNMPAGRSWS